MDSKTVKLNCLTLGYLENGKKWSVPLSVNNSFSLYLKGTSDAHFPQVSMIL